MFSFVAVLGNVVLIFAISLRNPSLRHNPSFMLIFALISNLAVSDVGIGLTCQPLAIALTVLEGTTIFELSYTTLSIAYKSPTG